jgi:hypothetical protein
VSVGAHDGSLETIGDSERDDEREHRGGEADDERTYRVRRQRGAHRDDDRDHRSDAHAAHFPPVRYESGRTREALPH